VPLGRGIAWPHTVPFARPEFHGGWCNGAAGLVQVWLAAFRTTRDPRWLALAEAAAWSVWDAADATWDLCCGRAGRSYALLEMANASGDESWRDRAVSSALRTITEMQQAPVPYVGLYRGTIGVIVLASDVAMAAPRSMPFFGSEP
jgi:serine/threonine-protein kinase